MIRRLFILCLGALAVLIGVGLPKASRSEPSFEELEPLVQKAIAWIEEQRRIFRSEGRPLNEVERQALDPFFPAEVLDEARIAFAPRIGNPPFITELGTRADGSLLFDVRSASAIAFVDTVVAAETRTRPGTRRWVGLLFHELVHLTQYRLLGTEDFIRRYIQSMVDVSFAYPAIAHEAQAFSLQRRFEGDPGNVFSVESEVRRSFRLDSSPIP